MRRTDVVKLEIRTFAVTGGAAGTRAAGCTACQVEITMLARVGIDRQRTLCPGHAANGRKAQDTLWLRVKGAHEDDAV